MARGDLLCPIDGLVLGLPTIAPLPGTAIRDSSVGDHLHVAVTANFTCLNGHRWVARDTFTLERMS